MEKIKCGSSLVYTIIKISGGYVKSIYDEDGRSGGYLYKRNEFNDGPSSLQERLNHVAYDYGREKYNAVIKSAYNESLATYAEAYNVIKNRVQDRIQSSINYHQEEINKLRKEMKTT